MIAMIPATLAEHYLDVYGAPVDDDQLSALYAPYERYLLGQSEVDLRGDIYVPILGANLKETAEGDSSVITIDDSWKPAFLEVTAASYDKSTIGAARNALLIKGATVRVEGFGSSHFSHPSQEANDSIERFFEALAVEAPGVATWVEFAILPCNWSANYRPSVSHPKAMLRRDYATRIDSVLRRGRYDSYDLDEDTTHQVLANQQRLKICNKSARVAAKRLARARARPDDDDRIIDLCIGLEALLGSGFSETVHRLSMRAAALLGRLWDGSSADLYKATRDLYHIRSRLVHGDHKPYDEPMLKVGGDQVHASRFAVAALASLLRHLIPDDRFDPAKVDEQFIFTAFDAVTATQINREKDSPQQDEEPESKQ